MTKISIGNDTYPIEYFMGGDWKFLASVCGIGGANADYACIWCRCPKLQRHDTTKVWPLVNENQGGRTLKTIKKNLKGKKFNCNHPPLFTFIKL